MGGIQKALARVFEAPILKSRTDADKVTARERWLGYFLGPSGASLMNSVLGSYLNAYYTDVLSLTAIWGGMFLGMLPALSKVLSIFSFMAAGRSVDATRTAQGKARPWVLVSIPLMVIAYIALFAVPESGEGAVVAWVFLAYNLFYSIAYAAYSTAHTLLVPLSTTDLEARNKLSVFANAQVMISGTFSAVLMPGVLMPWMGVSKGRWVLSAFAVGLACGAVVLLEYFFTRERNEADPAKKDAGTSAEKGGASLAAQLRLCLKSRSWTLVMLFVVVSQLANAVYSAFVIYYCNWVLGSYNDGITQVLFYAIGNFPLGLGIFMCAPLCKKFGRKKTMVTGYLISVAGCVLCLAAPRSLVLVLAGQFVKSLGMVPATYMTTALLADALDDVEASSGQRADGFSSAMYNIVVTLSSAAALLALNLALSALGYQAPTAELVPVQNDAIQTLFIAGALGSSLVGGIACSAILAGLPDEA